MTCAFLISIIYYAITNNLLENNLFQKRFGEPNFLFLHSDFKEDESISHEKELDRIKVSFRQAELKKCAELIYDLEPKLKENSYEMGVLVYFKGLIFEEINEDLNYRINAERLVKISENVDSKDHAILLYCLVLDNQIQAEYQKNNKKEVRRLLYKERDTLEYISRNNRTSDFYYQKGRVHYLSSISFIEFNDLKRADSVAELSLKYFNMLPNPNIGKMYYYKTKGHIKANEKKPNEALMFYTKVLDVANQLKARRNLRDIYPMLNSSYDDLKEFKIGSHYLLKYKMTNDTINNEKRLAAEVIAKKEKDIIEQQNSKSLKQSLIILSILLIVAFFIVRHYWRKYSSIERLEEFQKQKNPYADLDIVSPEDLEQLVNLSKTDENSFYLKFAECYPKLYHQLIEFQPKLSDSEIKFCAYLSMKYTVKEISIYSNTTIKSVESRKYRLKKKLNIDGNENLMKKINL